MKDNAVSGTILVCSPSKPSIRKIPKVVGNNHFKWVYFGENIPNALKNEVNYGKGRNLSVIWEFRKIDFPVKIVEQIMKEDV